MELVERALGASLFALHAAACRGDLPGARASSPALRGEVRHGKAIVYAPHTLAVAGSDSWIERGVRDVPQPGDVIEKGRPICTVFARATSRTDCLAALEAAAAEIVAGCAPAERAAPGSLSE